MNIGFYKAHTDTLRDLQNIAEKHNCYIQFGFDSNSGADIDEDLLEENGFDIEALRDLSLEHECYERQTIWFNLVEKSDTTKYHSLSYTECNTYFWFDEDELCDCENEEFVEFMQNHHEYEGFIHKSDNYTLIMGFGLETPKKCYLVYRSGMALKFFGDYVCDYLGEERIDRVY